MNDKDKHSKKPPIVQPFDGGGNGNPPPPPPSPPPPSPREPGE